MINTSCLSIVFRAALSLGRRRVGLSKGLWIVAAIGAGLASPQNTGVPFTRLTIDRQPPAKPYYKMAGDIDGDGNLDIVVAGDGRSLVWYAFPSWKKTAIAEGGWSGVNGEIVDLDGDGDQDIVMGGVLWFRNPRVGGGSWEKHQIDNQQVHDIEVGDLDLDGRPDLVARDQSAFRRSESDTGGSALYVYFQTGPNSWKKTVLDCPHGEGLKLADIDQDGDPDIVIGGRWYENTRGGAGVRWPEHVYTRLWTEPDVKVEVSDFNGDSKPDIVLTPSELRGETYRVAWYEHPSKGPQGEWTEHVIIPSIECVIHALGVGDVDGDGDPDVVIAEMHQGEDPDEVSLLLNEAHGIRWRKQVISKDGSHDIVVADIGDDGDLDIIGANHAGVHPLELWRNDLNKLP